MTRITKNYDEKFKQEAIKLALNSTSIKGAARALGIADSTLHGWLKKVKEENQRQVIINIESLFNKPQLNEETARIPEYD